MPAIVPGLPGGGLPDQVLKLGENGRAQWVDPVAVAQKFRGEWAPDEIAKVYTFSTGIPAEFTSSKAGTYADPVAAAVTGPSAASAPPYTGAVRFTATAANQNNNYSQLVLDLSTLGISGITRAACWFATADAGSTLEDYAAGSLVVNGSIAATAGGTGSAATNLRTWRKVFCNVDSDDILGIRARDVYPSNFNTAINTYMTGLEIYAADEPYMLGQYVTYNGKMWRSLVDNNAATPAQGSYWTEALTLPLSSGTTAARPTAATAGLGFQYFDTTLNKPIWSTGAAWVDATGAAV